MPAPVSAEGPLRVIHVDTERSWGGGQRQVHALATMMRQRGHETWVVTRPDSLLAGALTRDGVPVVAVKPAFEWDPVSGGRLRALVRRVRPDVVHAHAAHALAIAALAALGTRTPILAARRVALPLRRNPLSRWKHARVTRFVAVSERVRRALAADGIAPERISVVRSGVDLCGRRTSASAATLHGLGLVPGRALVVMVSALVPPHKDPRTFLEAIAATRRAGHDVQALLVGGGPLLEPARRTCRELGLDGAVRLSGFRADAVELLAAADVAVLSSRDEGLGTTLLDAMAAGVPIVATAAGGVTEIVQDGVNGLLVPVGDGAALGAGIGRVLDDAGLRRTLVAGGLERVRAFSVERTVEETLAVYRLVARGGAAAPRTSA